MNNKGLYTSALGILILLLISANIFVFLGADNSSSGGSNIADEIMDVKTSWHKAAFLAESAVEQGYYDSVDATCVITTLNFDFDIVSDNFNGVVSCNASYSESDLDLTLSCNSDNVSYSNTFKVWKDVQLDATLGCTIIDKYANDERVYP